MERSHKAILCLCHDPNMLKVRRLLLERFGYQVWPADSADGAKALASKVCPDMLLMDTGYRTDNLEELAQQVKDICPDVIAVMLSPSFTIHPSSNGAIDRYVPREEQPGVLIAHIRQLLEQRVDDAHSETVAGFD